MSPQYLHTVANQIALANQIAPFLTFIDSMNFRKTATGISRAYNCTHDPRLDNQFAIQKSVLEGNLGAVKCLVNVPFVDLSIDNDNPIRTSSKNGHLDIVKILIENGPVVDVNTSLKVAAEYGHADIVKLLIVDYHVDPAIEENYPFRIASGSGHPDVVRILIVDDRADPTYCLSMIMEILPCGDTSYDDASDDESDDPAPSGIGPLTRAAKRGYMEVVKILLNDSRTDPSEALQIAATYGRVN
jgi:ankyrin repeat protein